MGKLIARAGAAIAVVTVVLAGSAAAVSAQPGGGRVGPNQTFGALVNGRTGYPQPVTIAMACFGPIRPGQTGHPFADQTVKVFRPEVVRGHFGFTGPRGTSIGAFFGAPPPLPVAAASSYVNLTSYGVAKVIPTSATLPCGGSGYVTFVPLPMSAGQSRTATVPVRYVGQP